jgi:two-component system, LytTR family, response regulator
MGIRVVIADDEALARDQISDLLKRFEDCELVGVCADGRQALTAIEENRPDLLFLDIEMPELNGFEVLQEIRVAPMPAVVFVTAYDKYAIQAFEAHALDYLLKPFDFERFERTLQRARKQIAASRNGELNEKLIQILQSRKSEPKFLDRLAIKSRGRVIFLRTDEITWIEAAGNYLELHTGKESHLIREPISDFEQRLNPERFIRIHRSCIVNVESIKELQPGFGGEYLVVMNDGQQLTASRGYRERLQQLLSNEL